MGTVYITRVSGAGSGGERPTESVSLTYQTIQWTYQKLDGSGNPTGAPVMVAVRQHLRWVDRRKGNNSEGVAE